MEGEGRPEGKREGGREIEGGNICHGMHDNVYSMRTVQRCL